MIDPIGKTVFVLIAVIVVILQRYKSGSSNHKKWTVHFDPAVRASILMAFPAGLGLASWYVGKEPINYATPEWLRWIGLSILLLGFALWLSCVYTLRANWFPGVAIRRQHQLITNGPYRRIRHPMYLAFQIIGVGVSFLTPVWLMGVPLACYFSSYLLRIPFEEEMLAKTFGKKWEQYRKGTGILLPLWRNHHSG